MPDRSVSPDEASARTTAYYRRAAVALQEAGIDFLIGGGHAVQVHTGLPRHTRDFDLFLVETDIPPALRALSAAGFRTELAYSHWLAKAHFPGGFIDLIFNSGNGCCPVDRAWFDHAREHTVLDMRLKVCPPEETIWQKAFIMERERFDGADIAHLLRMCGARLDWRRLLDRFGTHGQVLLAHLVLFQFIFPAEAALVSDAARELWQRLHHRSPGEFAGLCRGTLLSRSQYLCDVARGGCRDARLAPLGSMTNDQIARWTAGALAD
jgi:hypothetical protein